MSAAALVRRAVAAGVLLKVRDERLLLAAAARPDDDLLEQLRSAKPLIVAYLRGLSCWDEDDWRALHDERAGIMEFDGGLSRAEAGTAAAKEVNLLRSMVRSGDG